MKYIVIKHSVAQGNVPDDGGEFDSLNISRVVVEVVDNDRPGVVVAHSDGGTIVGEGNTDGWPADLQSDTYSATLSSQPTGDVTITITQSLFDLDNNPLTATTGQLSLSTTTLTFTALNWNVAQLVTIGAIDDAINEGLHFTRITHTITSSADTSYVGLDVKSVDVKITDNDVAGVLVTQTGGSTNVTEPTTEASLGSGQVTGAANPNNFTADFGSSEINEAVYHATLTSAQNLDLSKWSLNSNPDITSSTTLPHITIHGTGDGTKDFYKFTGEAGDVVILDIDHGFEIADFNSTTQTYWNSVLTLYKLDADGQTWTVVTQGLGYSDTTVGGTGSDTWSDDFISVGGTPPTYYYDYAHLAGGLPTDGTYAVEVSSLYWWSYSNTLGWQWGYGNVPNGANYDLHVSVESHPVTELIFSPNPVGEDEFGNDNGTGQNVDPGNDWYTFGNPEIGNGTTVNSNTPYVKIIGSGGNGSPDRYSFDVSDAMLSPTAGTLSGNPVAGIYYTNASIQINASLIGTGDIWTVRLNGQNYQYTVGTAITGFTGTLLSTEGIAAGLAAAISPAFSPTSTAGSSVLTLSNTNGFTIGGVTQQVVRAGTVTHTIDATQQDGTSALHFSTAKFALSGTPVTGETWSVKLDGVKYDYVVGTAITGYSGSLFTADAVAAGLAEAVKLITGYTRSSAAGNILTVVSTLPAGFTAGFVVEGASPTGSAVISGAPVSQAEAANVKWNTVSYTLSGTVKAGEIWKATLGGVDYLYIVGTPYTGAPGNLLTTDAVAGGLASVIKAASAYATTSATGSVLTVRNTVTSFTSAIGVAAAPAVGTITFSTSHVTTAAATIYQTVVTLAGNAGTTGSQWTVSLNGTPYTYTTAAGNTLDDVLRGLRNLIPSTFATAINTGSNTLIINSTTTFTVATSQTVGGTISRPPWQLLRCMRCNSTVTGNTFNNKTWRLTLGGVNYDFDTNTGDTTSTVVAVLKNRKPPPIPPVLQAMC